MDVKEFVAETLKQITEAIHENPSTLDTKGRQDDHLQKIKIHAWFGGWITCVDFDIAVTQATSKEGGAKLEIAGVGGIGGDLKSGSEVVSRVQFRIPIEITKRVRVADQREQK